MVTFPSPRRKHGIHARGLMLNLNLLTLNLARVRPLRRQFRGDWSQRMTSFTSEFDSNKIAGQDSSVIEVCHTTFSVSLRTSTAHQRIHQWLRHRQMLTMIAGYVSIIFCFCQWLSLSLSSIPFRPVNDYSEGRWPIANVGVHSSPLICRRHFLVSRCSIKVSEEEELPHL